MNTPPTIRPLRRKLVMLAVLGSSALGLVAADLAAPRTAFAQTSSAQSDPAWDFGRGGSEAPGQPACYRPAPNVTERKMYNLNRPSCFPYHMQ